MVYFLGRDVHVALTTEHALCGLSINEDGNAYVDNIILGEVTGIDASSNVFTLNASHGLSTDDPVMVTMDADDSVGCGLTAGNRLYAIPVDGEPTKLKVSTTKGGSAASLTDSEALTTSITRELSGNASGAPHTFIMNRHWPNHDGTGRIDTIKSDSGSSDRRGIITSGDDKNSLDDITGIDITFGKTDEDIVYFGQRTALKAEIKSEVTISITKKKTDHRFNALFNKARCGILTYTNANKVALEADSTTATGNSGPDFFPVIGQVEVNDTNPEVAQPDQNFGYRLHLITKSGSEVVSFRNICMTSYATTLNADGVTEETIEFYGHVDPVVDGDATFGNTTLTAATDI